MWLKAHVDGDFDDHVMNLKNIPPNAVRTKILLI